MVTTIKILFSFISFSLLVQNYLNIVLQCCKFS